MALTLAHYDGRERFGWDDLVEAMTTVESGTAVGIEYSPHEKRATAIHEAGHAVARHVYMEDPSRRGSRSASAAARCGHHQALEKEERFSSLALRGGRRADLGARRDGRRARLLRREHDRRRRRRAERDARRPRWMVGACGDGARAGRPDGRSTTSDEDDEAREQIMKRFERIGTQIMNRTAAAGRWPAGPDRPACSATRQARRWPRRSSARRTWRRTTSSTPTATASSTSRTC